METYGDNSHLTEQIKGSEEGMYTVCPAGKKQFNFILLSILLPPPLPALTQSARSGLNTLQEAEQSDSEPEIGLRGQFKQASPDLDLWQS